MASKAPGEAGASPPGLNPGLRQDIDHSYSEANNGSEPLETVSVKPSGPAVWPYLWAIVTIGLSLLTLWLLFG